MENIFEILAVIIFTLILFMIFALPGIIICWIGWKSSIKIKNKLIKNIVRGGLISIAITPSVTAHGGFYPAIWGFFVDPRESYFTGEIIGLLVVWLITVLILQKKNKKTGHPLGDADPVEPG